MSLDSPPLTSTPPAAFEGIRFWTRALDNLGGPFHLPGAAPSGSESRRIAKRPDVLPAATSRALLSAAGDDPTRVFELSLGLWAWTLAGFVHNRRHGVAVDVPWAGGGLLPLVVFHPPGPTPHGVVRASLEFLRSAQRYRHWLGQGLARWGRAHTSNVTALCPRLHGVEEPGWDHDIWLCLRIGTDGTPSYDLESNAALYDDDYASALARWFAVAATRWLEDADAPHPGAPRPGAPAPRRTPPPAPQAPDGPPNLPSAIEHALRIHGERPAVSTDGRTLTYRALDARSSPLARRLARALEGRGGRRVAIVSEKTAEAVVGVVAIVRAGGVYVPIRTDVPPGRRAALLEELGVEVVLADTPGRAGLCGFHGTVIPPGGAPDATPGAITLCPPPTATDPAYVIMTSGSMGAAKAVEVGHGALLTFLRWKHAYYGFGPSDRWLQVAPFGFDSSISDIFGTLTCGACLVLATSDVLSDPEAFWELVEEDGVTHFAMVPSVLARHLEHPAARSGSLRAITVAGETLTATTLGRIQERLRGVRIVNEYGPAENSVCSTAADVTTPVLGVPPIGRPLPHVRVHIVDSELRPMPPGAVGEIALAGAGLALGYAGSGGATEERFVPLESTAERRVYLTGDLGRWRLDGELLFHGRIDRTLKLGGQRVEPSALEQLLCAHPSIGEAWVHSLPREEAGGLVAYVTASGSIGASALRRYVALRLPAAYVPSRVVFVDALPRGPGGKVDTARLPSPQHQPLGTPTCPASAFEAALLGVWERVVAPSPLGMAGDFYALGGSSLQAVALVGALQAEMGVEASVQEILEHPSLSDLATHLAARTDPRPLRPGTEADGDRIELSPTQRHLLTLQELAGADDPSLNVPEVLLVRGVSSTAVLENAVQGLVRRHEILRTEFLLDRAAPGQRVRAAEAVTIASRSFVDAEDPLREALETAERESRRPFDLKAGPPVRVLVLRFAPNGHVLALILHHLVTDGWSGRVLLKDLGEELRLAADPALPPRDPLSVQFRDVVRWLAGRLSQPSGQEDRAFWLTELEPVPARASLPSDGPGAVRGEPTGFTTLSLSGRMREALRDLAEELSVGIFTVVSAAVALIFSRYSGEERLVLGTVSSGRIRREMEDQVGPYVNPVPLVFGASPELTVRDLVTRTWSTIRRAMAHQAYPFDRLLSDLGLRGTAGNPLFDVLVVPDDPGIAWAELQLRGGPATLERVDLPGGLRTNRVVILVDSAADGIDIGIQYDGREYAKRRIARLREHLHRVLEQFVDGADRTLGSVDILTPAERRRILAFSQPER